MQNSQSPRARLSTLSLSLSLENAVILGHIKEAYLLWITIALHIPKEQRYTIGTRIENKFLDLLEYSYAAYFTPRERKAEKLDRCVYVFDIIKFFIHITWEEKLISHEQYALIAPKLEGIGKELGGWKKSLGNPEKKNHAALGVKKNPLGSQTSNGEKK